jgi:asparagine synthase (glutamine-hydrolysing)
MLDGVYSFLLFDNRITNDDLTNKIYVARDPYGVRPLYKLSLCGTLFGFASDLKCLSKFYKNGSETEKERNDIKGSLGIYDEDIDNSINERSISQFQPGSYSSFSLSSKVSSSWVPDFENKIYFTPSFSYNTEFVNEAPYELLNMYCKNISAHLSCAVTKRCNTTERPVACLLSGGLDSSLISALVADHFRNEGKRIETYSIGLIGSEDMKNAKIVADWIASIHTEIVVTEKEMFDAIPEVITAIESYDTTTVRASIGNYLIGKYISKNSEAKVIFNGDGSDELLGGYLYMNKCPDDIEFDRETRRLLKDIHTFDVLRSDKSISSNGLEPRTPFLDRNFANYVLSIPPHFRNHRNFNETEKFLLRRSFSDKNYLDSRGKQIIPDEILYRKKEAFSDGVSSQGRSLYIILQEFIANYYNDSNGEGSQPVKPDIELEKKYYKTIFKSVFGECAHIIPYMWMPKYTNANDPSARTLTFYSDV